MTLARRISDVFVAPADGSGGRRGGARRRSAGDGWPDKPAVTAAASSPTVAVLAPPADAPALAAALALALVRGRATPTAVVCVWATGPARPQWRAPARPAAARLAATLAARGHEARPAGRLCVVRLAPHGEAAAAEGARVAAVAGTAPIVFALAGPRTAAFDRLLAEQDLVVVAVPRGSDPALAELAVAGLDRVLTCEVPPADPARALAAAGFALLPSARRGLADPMAALP